MRGHAWFFAVTLVLPILGCAEAPKPAPPAPAPAPPPAMEQTESLQPPPVIPIDPPPLEGRASAETRTTTIESSRPVEPAAPSSARALGNAVRRAFGISSSPPDPWRENERPQ